MKLDSFPPVMVEANTAPSLVQWVMKDDEFWLNTGLVSPPEMTRKEPWTWALFISLGAVIVLAISGPILLSGISTLASDFRATFAVWALSVAAKIVGVLIVIAAVAMTFVVLKLMSFKRIEQEWIRQNTHALTPMESTRIVWLQYQLEKQIQSMGETPEAYEILKQGMAILKKWNSLAALDDEVERDNSTWNAEHECKQQMDQLLAHATDTSKE